MIRRIEIIPTVKDIRNDLILGKTVIVIDVLRSTSSIVTAFLKGCKEVYPVETTGQALSLKGEDIFLVGERFGKKLVDFDLPNSPYEIFRYNVQDKKIVITTTNGTNAIIKASRADHVLIGAFLNADAVVKKAIQFDQDITILCAGTRDEFSLEDALCAGYMVQRLESSCSALYSDFALLLRDASLHLPFQIEDVLSRTATGMRLSEMGYMQDIRFCAQLNYCDIVPQFVKDRIIVQP